MTNRRKKDSVRVLAVKNTAAKFNVTEAHVRNLDLNGAKTAEGDEIKKFYAGEYARIKKATEMPTSIAS